MRSLFEIGPVVLEMKIIKLGQCIFSILLLYLHGKGQDPSFEQTWNPFTKECFVIYIKFVWYWPCGSGEDFFSIFIIFSLHLSPLGKGCGTSFEQSWIPFTQKCFVPCFVKIGSVVLEKNIFKFHQCIFTIS